MKTTKLLISALGLFVLIMNQSVRAQINCPFNICNNTTCIIKVHFDVVENACNPVICFSPGTVIGPGNCISVPSTCCNDPLAYDVYVGVSEVWDPTLLGGLGDWVPVTQPQTVNGHAAPTGCLCWSSPNCPNTSDVVNGVPATAGCNSAPFTVIWTASGVTIQ